MKSIVGMFSIGLGFSLANFSFSYPEVPGAPQQGAIAIVGGTVHPVSGPAIEGGAVVFEEGKITAVGKAVKIPAGARRIDAAGKHVYPGLIDANTDLGLIEIGAVRATQDQVETGKINPNVRAQVAVNPDSELIPVARSNGVLTALSVPAGGLISGTSALMYLDGWTWEEMTLAAPVGMHVRWPRMTPILAWWMEDSEKKQLQERDQDLESLQQAFADAQAYRQARAAADSDELDPGSPGPHDLRWQALGPVLERELPLFVHADEIQEIESAVAFAERWDLSLVLVGGYDAPRCAELLKRNDVPVIVGGVHRLPRERSDAYDEPFTLPLRLFEAGIEFCIAGEGGASRVRNLPYHAATAAAYGLPKDEALKAITLYPARILGAAARVGTLEPGKDATLFVATGDPLETTSRVEKAFIAGRQVDLSDRHKRLWKKYEQKYSRPQ